MTEDKRMAMPEQSDPRVHLNRGSPSVRGWSHYQTTVATWTLCGISRRLGSGDCLRRADCTEDALQVNCPYCLELMRPSSPRQAGRVLHEPRRMQLLQSGSRTGAPDLDSTGQVLMASSQESVGRRMRSQVRNKYIWSVFCGLRSAACRRRRVTTVESNQKGRARFYRLGPQ